MSTSSRQNGHAHLPTHPGPSLSCQYDELLWRFRAVFWEADPVTWRFCYVSEYAELLFGYPRRRWLEDCFWVKILHPQDRDFAVESCREATSRGADHTIDYRIIAADGRVVWVRDVVRVECDGFSRQPKRLYGIFVDITEQKERELQHEADQRKLRRLLEQIPVVIWTVNEELRFTSSQGHGLARLHLQENQVVGRTLYEYFATADDNYFPIAMHRRALAGESVSYDFIWQGRVFRTVLQPWREAEHITGVLGLALDVTEQRAETELLRKKLATEKRLTALVKRSERLLRALTQTTDPVERMQRAVQGLVHTFGCTAAAIWQRSECGKVQTLAQAGVPLEWQQCTSHKMPHRRATLSPLPDAVSSGESQLILLLLRRRQNSSWWLGATHPHWRQLPACTLRLLRMLADFLAWSVDTTWLVSKSELTWPERSEENIPQQHQPE